MEYNHLLRNLNWAVVDWKETWRSCKNNHVIFLQSVRFHVEVICIEE